MDYLEWPRTYEVRLISWDELRMMKGMRFGDMGQRLLRECCDKELKDGSIYVAPNATVSGNQIK